MTPNKLRDLLGNADLTQSARAAMSVATGVQDYPDKGVRLMGTAAAFLLAAEASGLPVTDVIGMARNCINTAEGKRPEFAAVADYVQHEVLA